MDEMRRMDIFEKHQLRELSVEVVSNVAILNKSM